MSEDEDVQGEGDGRQWPGEEGCIEQRRGGVGNRER